LATNNSAKELDGRRPIGVAVGYGLMVRCMIAAFLLIRSFGEALMAPPAVQAPAGSATAAGTDVFLRVLVTLAAIIITGQALAKLFGGTFVAARRTGSGSHNSARLGTLMNIRGLMELIILNVGLDLGIISPILFAMMVLMALAAAILTSRMLHRPKAQATCWEEEGIRDVL